VLAASNVRRRLEELQGFQKIYAPFDGVIYGGNTDVGALIRGVAHQGKSCFTCCNHTLRVHVAAPQLYFAGVRPPDLDEFQANPSRPHHWELQLHRSVVTGGMTIR
jgi:hypothetical protein